MRGVVRLVLAQLVCVPFGVYAGLAGAVDGRGVVWYGMTVGGLIGLLFGLAFGGFRWAGDLLYGPGTEPDD